jgi:hypothetical protein
MQEIEDCCRPQRSASEGPQAQDAQDDVDSTSLGSAVGGGGSVRSSASDVLSTVARASTTSTTSPPPNHGPDDGNAPEQAPQEPPLSTDSHASIALGQIRQLSASIKMIDDL